MKDSSGWGRQKMVDKAANEIVAERGCSIAEVKPFWVAKKLGVDPSGEIYDKVYDWQRRAEAENAISSVEVPVEAEAAVRNTLEHFTAEAMAAFTRAVRSAGGAIDHAAGLRIADAELRASRATSARIDVLALCRQAEADRDNARARVSEVEQELAAAERREERLIGRIEQREIDAIGKGEVPATAPEPDEHVASDVDSNDAESDETNGITMRVEPREGSDEQPNANASSTPANRNSPRSSKLATRQVVRPRCRPSPATTPIRRTWPVTTGADPRALRAVVVMAAARFSASPFPFGFPAAGKAMARSVFAQGRSGVEGAEPHRSLRN